MIPQQTGGAGVSGDGKQSTHPPQVVQRQDIRYNRRMMAFLQAQLDKVHGLPKPPHDAPQESVQRFDLQIAKGRTLLARHAAEFRIGDFYTVNIARDGVKSICKELKSLLRGWGMDAAEEINDTLSPGDVRIDREYLWRLLRYILTGDCSSADNKLHQQWHDIKCAHDALLSMLTLVDEGDISLGVEVGTGRWGIVRVGEWASCSRTSEERAVAVKVPKCKVTIEEVAKIINEAVIQGSLKHDHIVKLHAATTSGWLVMELADGNLQQVCDHMYMMLDWKLKRNLLEQAAAGVENMHSQNPVLVHSDLKPSNFLVFGSRPENFLVKVSDFGHTFEMRGKRSKTIGKAGGSPLWHAPEIYEGDLTEKSDVYSFGMVMYEIVTGRTPFDGVNEFVLMGKKRKGEEPCNVCSRDCPKEMLSLMRWCCDVDPQSRPDMADVRHRLQQLPEDWSHGASSASQQHPGPGEDGEQRGMVSQTWEARFNDINFEELVFSPGVFISFRSQLGAVLLETAARVTGFRASLSFIDMHKGSVIFVIEVDFSCPSAAGSFKEHMEQCGMQTKEESLLYGHRPEMLLVEETCTIDAQVSELENQVLGVMEAMATAADLHYGHSIIHFLQSRMHGLMQYPLKMPNNAVKDEWRDDLTALLYDMKGLLRLVWRHSELDMASLERTIDTCVAVEHVLRAVGSLVHKWGLPSVADVHEHVVPEECLETDQETLEKFLAYMFDDCPWPYPELDFQERQQWEAIEHCLQDNMEHLPVIPDDEIIWDERIAENVYKVRWDKAYFAAKQLVPTREQGMSLENFQKLHGDVHRAILDPTYGVKLHGITKSGAVLMDLAVSNLRQWYLSLAACRMEDRIALKLGLLAQAARALLSAHAWGRVYGNVKSSNFLLFGDDLEDCVVKIADLPLMVERWHEDCIPFVGTGRWMAKELYESQAVSFKSDVYSFGCIVYEVVMEELPFGSNCSELEVMNAKLEGKQPLDVPEHISQQWPVEVLDVMQQCCSPDPGARPCMQAVDSCFWRWHPTRPTEQGIQHGTMGDIPPWNHLPLPCDDGSAPLLLAARRGNVAAMEALLDRGASIEARDEEGNTPLLLAAHGGHVAAMKSLLDRDAWTEASDKGGRTPMTLSIQGGCVTAIGMLVAKGAHIHVKAEERNASLLLAATVGNVAAVEALVSNGAHIETHDKDGNTPLLLAAHGGHVGVIETLLARDAWMDVSDKDRNTPLHLAAKGGSAAAIEALIANGAQTGAINGDRKTPLHLAEEGGHIVAIEALLARGEQIEAVEEGRNAERHLATKPRCIAEIEDLFSKGEQNEPPGEASAAGEAVAGVAHDMLESPDVHHEEPRIVPGAWIESVWGMRQEVEELDLAIQEALEQELGLEQIDTAQYFESDYTSFPSVAHYYVHLHDSLYEEIDLLEAFVDRLGGDHALVQAMAEIMEVEIVGDDSPTTHPESVPSLSPPCRSSILPIEEPWSRRADGSALPSLRVGREFMEAPEELWPERISMPAGHAARQGNAMEIDPEESDAEHMESEMETDPEWSDAEGMGGGMTIDTEGSDAEGMGSAMGSEPEGSDADGMGGAMGSEPEGSDAEGVGGAMESEPQGSDAKVHDDDVDTERVPGGRPRGLVGRALNWLSKRKHRKRPQADEVY